MKSSILLTLSLSAITLLLLFAFMSMNTVHPALTPKTCCKTKCDRSNNDSLENVFYNPLNRLIVADHS